MPSLGVVIGDVVADFEPGFGQAGETAAVEQFGLATAPERFRLRVVVAVATSAHALQRAMFGNKSLKRVAVGVAHAADAPAAHHMALRLHFGRNRRVP